MDPVVHARMTMIIQEEKKLGEEKQKLVLEIPVWERRVTLATQKGMTELAGEASQRVGELKTRIKEIDLKLETMQMDKDMLRYESRRPSGREVERAEAMLEQVRLGGLVDPDSKDQEFKDLETQFNFDEEG